MPADSPDHHRPLPLAFRGYAQEPVDSLLAEVEKRKRSLVAERDRLRKNLEDTKKSLSEATGKLERHVIEEQALEAAEKRAASLEEKSRGLAAERDEAQAQLAEANRRLLELKEELGTHQERQNAIADALIAAELLKAEGREESEALRLEAERAAAETREQAEREAQQIARHAEQEAETIRREAHLKAATIVSGAETSKLALEEETQEIRTRAEAEAERLLAEARIRADQLVENAQQDLAANQHQAEDFLEDARSKLGLLFRDLLDQIGSMSGEEERPESGQPATREPTAADQTPA